MGLTSAPYNPFDKSVPAQENMGYCPYMEISPSLGNTSYQTLTQGLVAAENRAQDENTAIPAPLPNGGLFMGPQATGPWANIPVVPSDANLIHFNLRSAMPPPGATQQYVGTDRLGNNYAPMIGVYWYNPAEARGMHRMMVTKRQDEQ
jgi:hypothetical protein